MKSNRIALCFNNFFVNNERAIHELNYLFWECTRRCNLNCRHCGSDCVADYKVKDMPFEDFLNAILPLKKISKPDTITIAITGGEPLLRKDLPECGTELRKNGFLWGIVTNGYAYNADIHRRLLSAGIGAITLSLDGLADNHNWLRNNARSFANAVTALDLIASCGRLNYDVVTCVNKKNIKELLSLKEFLLEHKVRQWRLFTIAPIGRAFGNDDMQLSNEQVLYLMNFIYEARKDKRMRTTFSCESFVGKYERNVRDNCFFCRAGINIGSVLIDGSISACPNIDRAFVQGYIYRDNFTDVWNERFEIMRNRKWTRTGSCLNCKDYKYCKGGAMHIWDEKRDNILTCLHQQILSAEHTL